VTFTKVVAACGVVLLGFLCFLAAKGMTAVTEGLVTLFALVVMVAGGNLLSGRGAYGARRSPAASMPVREPPPQPAPAPLAPAAPAPPAPAARDAPWGEVDRDVIDPPESGQT
jgi:hypothetical protein